MKTVYPTNPAKDFNEWQQHISNQKKETMKTEKKTCVVYLDDTQYIEVEYEHWPEGPRMDYDSQPNPAGHEIVKIELYAGGEVIDITDIADSLSSELCYTTMERTIETDIL